MNIKNISVFFGVSILAGCAYNPVVPPTGHFTKPAIGGTSSAGVGEVIFSSVDGAKVPTITTGGAEGKLSIVKAGTYCEYEKNSNRFINPEDRNSVLLKTLTGRVVDSSGQNFIIYDKGKNEISVGNGAPYSSSEISFKYNPDGVCFVGVNSIRRDIEFNGKSGSVLNFVYREFNGSLARPAFTAPFSINLDETKNVRYKGASIKIESANSSEITYQVSSDFQ